MKIKAPTLIIHGDQDPIALPRLALSMTQNIPNSQVKLIKGMGHMFLSQDLEDKISQFLIEHMKKSGSSDK